MLSEKIALLGAGNMGEAIIRGMMAGNIVDPSRVTAVDVLDHRLATISARYGVRTSRDVVEAVSKSEIVLLAVKPQQMREVLARIAGKMPEQALVISIAAGITTDRIEHDLGGSVRVVRVMPNTPAQIGAGAAAIAQGRFATDADVEKAEAILGAIGLTVRTEERFLDAVTALSGSGPAYVFLVAEAMIRSGMEMGLSPEISRTLALQTILGAARLMIESGEHPESLRHKVTSPGGTTAAALAVMDDGGLVEVFVKAVKAAAHRARELSGS